MKIYVYIHTFYYMKRYVTKGILSIAGKFSASEETLGNWTHLGKSLHSKFLKLQIFLMLQHPHKQVPLPGGQVHQFSEAGLFHRFPSLPSSDWPSDIKTHQWNSLTSLAVISAWLPVKALAHRSSLSPSLSLSLSLSLLPTCFAELTPMALLQCGPLCMARHGIKQCAFLFWDSWTS